MKRILFVCLGNICRSPMAEFVMKDMLEKRGIAGVEVESAATSIEEVGNPVYPGARSKLAEHGISCQGKRARIITSEDYDRFDWLIGMDSQNLYVMRAVFKGDPQGKCAKLLSFCGEDGNVADPWYTGDFERTWQDVRRGCTALCDLLEREGKGAGE